MSSESCSEVTVWKPTGSAHNLIHLSENNYSPRELQQTGPVFKFRLSMFYFSCSYCSLSAQCQHGSLYVLHRQNLSQFVFVIDVCDSQQLQFKRSGVIADAVFKPKLFCKNVAMLRCLGESR